MVRQEKVNLAHQKKIALLIRRLKTGQATNSDKKLLEDYWENARRDTLIVDEMSTASCEKLKKEMFDAIQARLGLK